MSAVTAPRLGSANRWVLLAVSLGLVLVVSAVGGLATDTGSDSWYASLEQPAWNPPDWLFGPVWTVLYLIMAVAAWRVATAGLDRFDVRAALVVYAVQLALNLGWTLVFFGMEALLGGLVVIAALLVAIVATIVTFARVDRVAALLLVPYLAWVGYATALNAGILALN